MKHSAQLQELEGLLRERGLGKALPKQDAPSYPPAPTGWEALDGRLGGGLPRGAISEITGPESSGRTGLIFSLLARETATGAATAYVDACDALDPRSAAEAGVLLEQLLWVRCDPREPSRHERSQRPDQAWQAANLIAAAGGFGLIVVDLGGFSQRRLRTWQRRPWVRLQQTIEHTATSLVVLAEAHVAGSAAAVVTRLERRGVDWSGGVLLDGIDAEAQVVKGKVGTRDRVPGSRDQVQGTGDQGVRGRRAA